MAIGGTLPDKEGVQRHRCTLAAEAGTANSSRRPVSTLGLWSNYKERRTMGREREVNNGGKFSAAVTHGTKNANERKYTGFRE
jgi:hypothetical protein